MSLEKAWVCLAHHRCPPKISSAPFSTFLGPRTLKVMPTNLLKAHSSPFQPSLEGLCLSEEGSNYIPEGAHTKLDGGYGILPPSLFAVVCKNAPPPQGLPPWALSTSQACPNSPWHHSLNCTAPCTQWAGISRSLLKSKCLMIETTVFWHIHPQLSSSLHTWWTTFHPSCRRSGFSPQTWSWLKCCSFQWE